MTKPLSIQFNAVVLTMASKLFPCGFDVSETEAPSTYEALCASLNKPHARLCVYSGASDNTIFASPEVNWAFRAWHDWCHYRGGYDFTPQGEASAAAMQCQHLWGLFGSTAPGGDNSDLEAFERLIECEVNGQVAYYERYGEFPSDQMEFGRRFLEYGRDHALAFKV